MRVRVCGVLKQNNKILLAKHSNHNDEYWVLPGGGLENDETTEKCVVREFKEETSLDVKIIKLLFSRNGEHPPDSFEYFYLVKQVCNKTPSHLNDPCVKCSVHGIEWFNANDLDKINLRPIFIKKFLLEKFEELKTEEK